MEITIEQFITLLQQYQRGYHFSCTIVSLYSLLIMLGMFFMLGLLVSQKLKPLAALTEQTAVLLKQLEELAKQLRQLAELQGR